MIFQPTITIVIATYNAADTICKAIESVLIQDYKKLKLLVIDGSSTDETVDLANSFNDSRIEIVSEADNGIYDAWNKAVRIATSERMLFIGADDTLCGKSAISNFWNKVDETSNNCPVIYGDLIALDMEGAPIAKIGGIWRDPWSFSGRHIRYSYPIPIMSAFFHRNAILEFGLFDTSLKIMADIDLVLKISKITPPIYIPGCVVTLMGFGGISTRPDAGAMALREAYSVRRSQSLGTYTNLEFIARFIQHRIKYFVAKNFGQNVTKFMIENLHRIKKLMYNRKNNDFIR